MTTIEQRPAESDAELMQSRLERHERTRLLLQTYLSRFDREHNIQSFGSLLYELEQERKYLLDLEMGRVITTLKEK